MMTWSVSFWCVTGQGLYRKTTNCHKLTASHAVAFHGQSWASGKARFSTARSAVYRAPKGYKRVYLY